MRYQLESRSKLEQQLKRLYASINDEIALALLHTSHTPDTGVHRLRKRCKEMRALLRLLRPWLEPEEYARLQARYRDLAATFAGNRDQLVRLQTWEQLLQRHPRLQSDDYQPLTELLRQQASHSPVTLIGPGQLLELAAGTEAQRHSGARWSLPASFSDLRPQLQRLYRRARKAREAAAGQPDSESLHRLRKRGKDLYYGLRMVRPLSRTSLKPYLKALRSLTELQGEAHDLAILGAHLRDSDCISQLPLTPASWAQVMTCIDAQERALTAKVWPRARKLLRESSASFVKAL